jgi:hypothetical protein
VATEFLAQVVEMQSVLAADRRISEVVKIPRPAWFGGGDDTPSGDAPRNPFTAAIQRMLAARPPEAVA